MIPFIPVSPVVPVVPAVPAARAARAVRGTGLAGAVLAVAMFATAATVATLGTSAAVAATAAHDHAAEATQRLSLDQGRKWSTDDALREGMSRIRALVEPRLPDAHGGRLSDAQYVRLADQVQAQVAHIVANCKLEPQADAMLHLVIADIGEGVDAMAGKKAELPRERGLVRVALAVNDYGAHFEHPGFKPLRGLH